MKNKPKTITLDEFASKFSDSQLKEIDQEVKYYQMLAKIKEFREEKGMTQEELAQKAKVNRTTLSKIESGYRNATIETLMRLASAMGLSLELRLY